VPYTVRLKKLDGRTVMLRETFPDPAPCNKSEIALAYGGGTIQAKVEKCTKLHVRSARRGITETLDVVNATQLAWKESRPAPSVSTAKPRRVSH
jgi:hypothetical protein